MRLIIRRIDAMNFRSIKKETLKTTPEGFVISGGNGSGKSTWNYALNFAFYGGVPGLTIADLLSWGEKNGEVRVWFEMNGYYRITRSFNARSTNLVLETYRDEEWVNVGGELSTSAAAVLCDIFPVPQDVFNEIVIRRQGNFGSITETTPAGRYKLLRQLADIEVWEKYGRKNDEILSSLETLAQKAQNEYDSAKRTIEDMELAPLNEERRKELLAKMGWLEEQRKSAQEFVSLMKRYWSDAVKAKDALEFVEKHKGFEPYYELWQKVKHLKEPKGFYDPAQREAIKKSFLELDEQESSIPKEIETLERSIFEQDEAISKNEELLKEHQEVLSKMQNAFVAIETKRLAKKKEAELLEQGKCPTCERAFKNFGERVAKLEGEIAELLEEETSQGNAIVQKLKDIESLKLDTEKLRSAQRNHQSQIVVLTKLQGNIANMRQTLRDKETALDKLEEETKAYQEKKDFIENYPFDKTISPDETYKRLIEKRSLSEPEKPERVTSVPEAERELETIQSEIEFVRKAFYDMESKDKSFKYQSEQMEQAKITIASLKLEVDVHQKLRVIYGKGGAPRKIIQKWIRVIEAETNRQLERLTQSKFSVIFNDKTDTGRDTIDLAIIDNASGQERKFMTMSGGERTRVNVALTLALSNAFSDLTGIQIGTLWLDEVYGLDEGGQREFARIVEDIAKEKEIVCATSCFKSMSLYFNNVVEMQDGKLI
jgi:DNA repair exonuclease SbcCD ATPase subunit